MSLSTLEESQQNVKYSDMVTTETSECDIQNEDKKRKRQNLFKYKTYVECPKRDISVLLTETENFHSDIIIKTIELSNDGDWTFESNLSPCELSTHIWKINQIVGDLHVILRFLKHITP